MVLNKKQFLLLSCGIACSACVLAAPKDEERLQRETEEFIKHCVAYSKIAAPKGVQVALPYLMARELNVLPHSRQHKFIEAVGAVALWEVLKKSFSAATGLTEDSLPCDPAAHKAGSNAQLVAKTVNNMTWFAYKGLNLVGPMVLRELIAGDVKAHIRKR